MMVVAGHSARASTGCKARKACREVSLSTHYRRARGCPSIKDKAQSQQHLSPCEEKAVVKFLLHMEDLGQPVRIKYLKYIAHRATRHRPDADRPPKLPGKNWAQVFQQRHPELKARRVRALDWERCDIYDKTVHWFDVIGKELSRPDVLLCNVYNMDETGVMLSMLASVKVLVSKDERRGYRGARVKRETVTAIECVSADGRSLKPMIIWPAKSHRDNWTTFPTPGWHYAFSDSGYTDSKISLEWLVRVFDPQRRELAAGKPRILIWDGFGTHETLEVLEFCFEHDIILCRLPSHTSYKLQPCDVAVFGPLKAAYRDEVERLERGGVGAVRKEHFTYLYSPARDAALTARNIRSGFRASGLYPFNPERVLADLPKPQASSDGLLQSDMQGPAFRMDVQDPFAMRATRPATPMTPATPATPTTTQALTTLQTIIEHEVHPLDDAKQQRIRRRVQKVINAARTSFAERELLEDRAQFLAKINDESQVRRATKSTVLGNAKVMSYEDLQEARAKRAAKEAAKGNKGRRRGKDTGKGNVNDIAVRESLPKGAIGPSFLAPTARMM